MEHLGDERAYFADPLGVCLLDKRQEDLCVDRTPEFPGALTFPVGTQSR